MPLKSWNSVVSRTPIDKQRLAIGMRSQEYDVLDEGDCISAKIPKSFAALIKNGFQVFLVDKIVVTPQANIVQLQVFFSSSAVVFWLLCVVGATIGALSNVAAQDQLKVVLSIALLVPLATLVIALTLVSSIKRDVKNAVKASI